MTDIAQGFILEKYYVFVFSLPIKMHLGGTT